MLPHCRGVVLSLAAALIAHVALAQVEPLGAEYGISGPAAGDQVFPAAAVNASGGYVVYQDAFTDGNGFGISARRLDSTLSPSVLAPFRVNQQTVGNQQHPQVAVLPGGAAAFVWQGSSTRHDQIWFRALNANGTFANASEVRVNLHTNSPQTKPVIAALPNDNYAVAWESMHQDGDYKGIFMRIVGPAGQMVTEPANVNQFTFNNQRTPAIAALTGGGFIVLWASESEGLGPDWTMCSGSTYMHASTTMPAARLQTSFASTRATLSVPTPQSLLWPAVGSWLRGPSVLRVPTVGMCMRARSMPIARRSQRRRFA